MGYYIPEDNPISTPVTINGTTIQFPTSGDSPSWAPAVTEFAQLTEAALNSFVGPFDIPPQIFIMTANANTNVNLPNLAFPTSTVRGAIISYSVFRSTDTVTATETGTVVVNYNPTNPVGNKWEISTDFVGNSQTIFNITDVGQVQFSTTLISGVNYTGSCTYQAKAVLTT